MTESEADNHLDRKQKLTDGEGRMRNRHSHREREGNRNRDRELRNRDRKQRNRDRKLRETETAKGVYRRRGAAESHRHDRDLLIRDTTANNRRLHPLYIIFRDTYSVAHNESPGNDK